MGDGRVPWRLHVVSQFSFTPDQRVLYLERAGGYMKKVVFAVCAYFICSVATYAGGFLDAITKAFPDPLPQALDQMNDQNGQLVDQHGADAVNQLDLPGRENGVTAMPVTAAPKQRR
jgi:hypothetical protein